MIRYSTLDRRYFVVVGNKTRYADSIVEAMDILAAMKFLDKILKILPVVA